MYVSVDDGYIVYAVYIATPHGKYSLCTLYILPVYGVNEIDFSCVLDVDCGVSIYFILLTTRYYI